MNNLLRCYNKLSNNNAATTATTITTFCTNYCNGSGVTNRSISSTLFKYINSSSSSSNSIINNSNDGYKRFYSGTGSSTSTTTIISSSTTYDSLMDFDQRDKNNTVRSSSNTKKTISKKNKQPLASQMLDLVDMIDQEEVVHISEKRMIREGEFDAITEEQVSILTEMERVVEDDNEDEQEVGGEDEEMVIPGYLPFKIDTSLLKSNAETMPSNIHTEIDRKFQEQKEKFRKARLAKRIKDKENREKVSPFHNFELLTAQQVINRIEKERKLNSNLFFKNYLSEIRVGNPEMVGFLYLWTLENNIKDIEVFNTFIDIFSINYNDTGRIQKTMTILQNVLNLEYDINTYHILFAHFQKINDVESLERLFTSLIRSKLSPTNDTIRLLISSFGKDSNMLSKIYSYCSRHSSVNTVLTYNTLIANAIANNDSKDVKFLYKKLDSSGVKANLDTYYLVVSMYVALGKLDTAQRIVQSVPITLGHADILHGAILKSLIEQGSIREACRYFVRILRASHVRLDIVRPIPLGILIHTLLEKNLMTEFDIIVERLGQSNALSLSVYNTILYQLAEHNQTHKFMELYVKMIETVRPSFHTFKSLIQIAIKNKDIQGCKVLEHQILGELKDFKVHLYVDILRFYYQEGELESLSESLDYVFKAAHALPNGINHIIVQFEQEDNEGLVDYIALKMSECHPSFISIHITKTVQLLLVTGQYSKALKWYEMRSKIFGLPDDSFGVFPFYYFHKLRGEFDVCDFWRNRTGLDLETANHFENYLRLHLKKDGTFLDWKEFNETLPFLTMYDIIGQPQKTYLEQPSLSLFINREVSEKTIIENIQIEGYYEPVKDREFSNKATQVIINDPIKGNPEARKGTADVYVDFSSRVVALLDKNQHAQALEETEERELAGQFVGEFVYISLLNYLVKGGLEEQARTTFTKMIAKSYKPPLTLITKLFELTHQHGTLSFYETIDNRPSYADEKYWSYLLSIDMPRGLKMLQDRAREELLLTPDFLNSLAVGYLKLGSPSMAESVFLNLIQNNRSIPPATIKNYLDYFRDHQEHCEKAVLFAIEHRFSTKIPSDISTELKQLVEQLQQQQQQPTPSSQQYSNI